MDLSVIWTNIGFLAGGLLVTFQLAIIALIGGLTLGTAVAIARLSNVPWIYWPATGYVNFIRGIPLILVIFWLYFLMPVITGHSVGEFLSAAFAFVIFESSYFAEIMRAGIQSIRRGQVNAGLATGLSRRQVMRHIVLPQGFRNMIPSLLTQCIVLFQDTSLAYVIGVKEFLRRANLLDARVFRSVEIYLFVAVVYFILCYAGSLLSRRLESHRQRMA